MLADAGWKPEQIKAEYPVRAIRTLSGAQVTRDLGDGRVDYVLEAVPGLPVAVVEAKREYASPEKGLQQAIRYAQQLDVPLAYATDGRGTVLRDLRTGTERRVESVATPAEAWAEFRGYHGLSPDGAELLARPFNRRRTSVQGEIITPRWYQTVAVHRVLRAIASGRQRLLLLMATGTGKTFTAMQIVAKLRDYHALREPERNYRVLYLADLDILLRQPMGKDFQPAFGPDPLHRVRGGVNLSREIYFASYQAMTGAGDSEALFRDYPPDFFDLVIVDECHRGSAAENSVWRRVLDYFSPAVQVGLTATPKRDATVDSYAYFGDPVFSYSLRQGIEDGYLAPYRVRRVVLSPDAEGWSPEPSQMDAFGREVPEGLYSTRDFERVVSLLMRTRLAARHLSRTLRQDPTARTMIFCVDQEHAEQMRSALVAENPDFVRKDPEWVVRIVGGEPERERLLEAYTDPESSTPVVATTSRLLSTGVDVEDLRHVVLFRPIGSMVEFKQIIGRGTRLFPDKGKTSFDIIDYVGATRLFSDPDFDGDPVEIDVEAVDDDGKVVSSGGAHDGAESSAVGVAEPGMDFEVRSGGDLDVEEDGGLQEGPDFPRKYLIQDGSFSIVAEALQIPDTSTGKLRLTEYREYVQGVVRTIAASAGELAAKWAHAPTRQEVLAELERQHIPVWELDIPEGLDPLDVLLNLAWNTRPRTRSERARRVREEHAADIAVLGSRARHVLEVLLDRYADYGIDEITSSEILGLESFSALGSPVEIAAAFGGPQAWHQQLDHVQQWLYSA